MLNPDNFVTQKICFFSTLCSHPGFLPPQLYTHWCQHCCHPDKYKYNTVIHLAGRPGVPHMDLMSSSTPYSSSSSSSFLLYWCYCRHTSKDLVSRVCGIFRCNGLDGYIFRNRIFTEQLTHWGLLTKKDCCAGCRRRNFTMQLQQ